MSPRGSRACQSFWPDRGVLWQEGRATGLRPGWGGLGTVFARTSRGELCAALSIYNPGRRRRRRGPQAEVALARTSLSPAGLNISHLSKLAALDPAAWGQRQQGGVGHSPHTRYVPVELAFHNLATQTPDTDGNTTPNTRSMNKCCLLLHT